MLSFLSRQLRMLLDMVAHIIDSSNGKRTAIDRTVLAILFVEDEDMLVEILQVSV